MNAEFDMAVQGHGPVCVVQPRGRLTERTGAELRRALIRTLLEHRRVVADLDGFQVAHAAGVAVFPAVLDQCGGWPRAKLVLCRADQEMARALAERRISTLVPVYHLLPEAEEAVEQRPALVRARVRLMCDDHAPDVARQLVRDTCPMWQVGAEQQQIAELVVNELVDNAVRHARSGAALTLERGPRGLRIAVRDTASSSVFVHLAPGSTPNRRAGRGLELVARLTTAWGVEMHPVGKTVWAEIAQRGCAR
jgi:anti-sigma regulatory factor (Ser/Thr protein kinase)/anti-anti-sigma regulatory factor